MFLWKINASIEPRSGFPLPIQYLSAPLLQAYDIRLQIKNPIGLSSFFSMTKLGTKTTTRNEQTNSIELEELEQDLDKQTAWS